MWSNLLFLSVANVWWHLLGEKAPSESEFRMSRGETLFGLTDKTGTWLAVSSGSECSAQPLFLGNFKFRAVKSVARTQSVSQNSAKTPL